MMTVRTIPLVAMLGASLMSTSTLATEPLPPDAATSQVITASLEKQGGTLFPIGKENVTHAKHFTGMTYLAPLGGAKEDVHATNVTFAPGVINHWHIHTQACQVLVTVSGRGYYQIWGEDPKEVKPGDTVTIPAGTKHWHGAAKDGWYQHIAIMNASPTKWLEPVDPKEYAKLR